MLYNCKSQRELCTTLVWKLWPWDQNDNSIYNYDNSIYNYGSWPETINALSGMRANFNFRHLKIITIGPVGIETYAVNAPPSPIPSICLKCHPRAAIEHVLQGACVAGHVDPVVAREACETERLVLGKVWIQGRLRIWYCLQWLVGVEHRRPPEVHS